MIKNKTILICLMLICICSPLFSEEPILLIFGGNNHDKFLGCLNCSKHDPSSIWNAYGQYGSKYNSDSIWNRYGIYGSKYSPESPWNRYSTDGPVIVDPDGNFYGKFTTNKYNNQTKIEWLIWLLNNYEYVMDNLDEIRDNF